MPSVTFADRGRARERRAAVERRVLDAVERLLQDGESFTALGVGRIADEAGMARTTFYGHFPDKATLLVQLVETVTAALFAQGEAWLTEDAASWREHVDVLAGIVAERRRHQPLLLAFDEVAAYDPEVGRHADARLQGLAGVLQARIERDVEAGLVTAPIDPRVTAQLVVLGTVGVIARQAAREPPASDAAFAEGLARATWAAIGRA